mmetsp:Transcript_32507/g.52678  ORF Transcript_32507/g.52678 Transcript_32507/m.52678 type:complete len:369 (-) Transcript_32507:117-1223(-)
MGFEEAERESLLFRTKNTQKGHKGSLSGMNRVDGSPDGRSAFVQGLYRLGPALAKRGPVILVFVIIAVIILALALSFGSRFTKFLTSIPVEENNPLHMFYLFLGLLTLSIPLPIPAVMFSLCVLGGFYFKYYAFLVVSLSFLVNLPVGFLIGRLFQRKYGAIDQWGGTFFSCCLKRYARLSIALRRAFENNPIRICVFWMWTPLPAQLEPFLLGAATKVPLKILMLSGYPSKCVQGMLMSVIGMQASTLADALEHGTDHPADIAVFIIGIAFTVILMSVLGWLLRKELQRLQQEEFVDDRLEDGDANEEDEESGSADRRRGRHVKCDSSDEKIGLEDVELDSQLGEEQRLQKGAEIRIEGRGRDDGSG